MTDNDNEYKIALTRTIRTAVTLGASNLREICSHAQGARPDRVERILRDLKLSGQILSRKKTEARHLAAKARSATSAYLKRLPAANPEASQWWFTLDGVEKVAEALYFRTQSCRPCFLGASTLAPYYSVRFDARPVVLDFDRDIVAAAARASQVESHLYDANRRLPRTLTRLPFDCVVIDPPWYPEGFRAFLVRASQLCRPHALVFCTLPGVLTRSDELKRRAAVLEEARNAGLVVVDILTGVAEYVLPKFERRALDQVGELDDRPWRYGDIAILQKETRPNPLRVSSRPSAVPFSREPGEFRFFLDESKCAPSLRKPLEYDPSISELLGRHEKERAEIALWTSDNRGFRISRNAFNKVRHVLQAWSETSTNRDLEDQLSGDTEDLIWRTLKENVKLLESPKVERRTPAAIRESNRQRLSRWACPDPESESGKDDNYRTSHARDRDRVVWSTGFRRLANKTQVFSTSESDFVRHRLAHSIEVMQLACTIGDSFGLNRDLIEAGALAHDVGHTPFGHAGEEAMDATLRDMAPNAGGFNHYEHGLDVMVWLEDAYRHPSSGGKHGLDLSAGVLECILKHTFCYGEGRINQKELYAASKHKSQIPDGPCHLEGQAVRSADKISYLISDIEDGLSLGAVSLHDLKSCSLFRRIPIDLKSYDGDSALDVFLSQRSKVISILMEDIIDSTARRLLCADVKSMRVRTDYLVNHSDETRAELNEVWKKVQAGRLHRDGRVVAANRRSAEIIHKLLTFFTVFPEAVDSSFLKKHRDLAGTPYMKWYCSRDRVKGFRVPRQSAEQLHVDFMISPPDIRRIQIEDMVLAKDYVASMTDRTALVTFNKYFSK